MPKNNFTLEMKISDRLMDAFSKREIESLYKRIIKGVARHLVGKNHGETPAQSPIGRHFSKSNVHRYGFARLSEKYAIWKRKKVGNKAILVFSGEWRKKALHSPRITEIGKIVRLEPKKPPHYAEHLEFGTKTMPARPAFTVNSQDERSINRYLKNSVPDEVKEHFEVGVANMVKVV